jgi:NAD(P)-dependent dehydrogenase (short-subunit alcohol dehydrogenase family)
MSGVHGQIALVTGGAGGLGLEICRMLTSEGATAIIADVRIEQAEHAAQTLQAERRGPAASGTATNGMAQVAQGTAIPMHLDVTSEESVQAAVQSIIERHGRLDILVNNAGVDVTLPVDEITVEAWDRILGINLRGPFVLARLAFPIMRQQGSGQIVNITSTAGKRAWANASAYHASKWGLLGLSHALHVEGRAIGVGVTAVIAGGMRTPFLFDRFPDLDPDLLQEPSAVANAVRFALSQPAGSVVPEITVLPVRETSWP